MSREHGLLFSAAMIKALRAGRKTQTRRLAKPRWVAGDTIWVRENFSLDVAYDGERPGAAPNRAAIFYKADGEVRGGGVAGKGRPSIHMPRWASRMAMTVLAVRQEPLMAIMPLDAIAEGVFPASRTAEGVITSWLPVEDAEGQTHMDPRDAYYALWDMINGEGASAANPTVWVTVFSPPR